VEKRGKRNLPDILDYYVSIGWITDDVRLDLIGYSKGIIEEEPQADQKGSAHLPTKDHLQSLLYVSKLKGLHLDDRFLYRIERDLEKLTRCLQDQPDQATPNGH
jgi:flagellar protein FlaD